VEGFDPGIIADARKQIEKSLIHNQAVKLYKEILFVSTADAMWGFRHKNVFQIASVPSLPPRL